MRSLWPGPASTPDIDAVEPYRCRHGAWDDTSRALSLPKWRRSAAKILNRSPKLVSAKQLADLCTKDIPCWTIRHHIAGAIEGGRWVYRPNGLFFSTQRSRSSFCAVQPALHFSQRSGRHFLSFREIAVMSSSPEADKLEQSLLDGCANTEYVGRRPSSSGRDTKRISACYLQSYLYLFMPLSRVSPCLGCFP